MEIVSIVEEAYENHRKIRVLAAGHSWSEIAQTTDIMISLSNYTGLVSIDKDKLEATFRAGSALRDISEALEAEGFAMLNLGSVAYQSIAGAISTGKCLHNLREIKHCIYHCVKNLGLFRLSELYTCLVVDTISFLI